MEATITDRLKRYLATARTEHYKAFWITINTKQIASESHPLAIKVLSGHQSYLMPVAKQAEILQDIL